MIRELAEVVDAIAVGEARSHRPEDRKLAKDYLAALAPILAGAVSGRDMSAELSAFGRLLGHTWLVDDEPFREGLSKWRKLNTSRGEAQATANAEAAAHFQSMLGLVERVGALPARVREHTYSYDSFGSWTVSFDVKGVAVRIVCDGRERELLVERSAARESPHMWEPVVRLDFEARHTLGPEVVQAIEQSAG